MRSTQPPPPPPGDDGAGGGPIAPTTMPGFSVRSRHGASLHKPLCSPRRPSHTPLPPSLPLHRSHCKERNSVSAQRGLCSMDRRLALGCGVGLVRACRRLIGREPACGGGGCAPSRHFIPGPHALPLFALGLDVPSLACPSTSSYRPLASVCPSLALLLRSSSLSVICHFVASARILQRLAPHAVGSSRDRRLHAQVAQTPPR